MNEDLRQLIKDVIIKKMLSVEKIGKDVQQMIVLEEAV
jgi:hypothetical protein